MIQTKLMHSSINVATSCVVYHRFLNISSLQNSPNPLLDSSLFPEGVSRVELTMGNLHIVLFCSVGNHLGGIIQGVIFWRDVVHLEIGQVGGVHSRYHSLLMVISIEFCRGKCHYFSDVKCLL